MRLDPSDRYIYAVRGHGLCFEQPTRPLDPVLQRDQGRVELVVEHITHLVRPVLRRRGHLPEQVHRLRNRIRQRGIGARANASRVGFSELFAGFFDGPLQLCFAVLCHGAAPSPRRAL